MNYLQKQEMVRYDILGGAKCEDVVTKLGLAPNKNSSMLSASISKPGIRGKPQPPPRPGRGQTPHVQAPEP
jgi:hypothetical protein